MPMDELRTKAIHVYQRLSWSKKFQKLNTDRIELALREAYEQGRRDENEACAKLADDAGVTYDDRLSALDLHPIVLLFGDLIRQRLSPNAEVPKETKNG